MQGSAIKKIIIHISRAKSDFKRTCFLQYLSFLFYSLVNICATLTVLEKQAEK